MTTLFTIGFMLAAAFIAYKIGENRAGVGVAFFIAAMLSLSIYLNGWESLWREDWTCTRYSSFAEDC